MRAATDADFNNGGRYFDYKLDIYFDSTPLTVTKVDYLIDVDWLEEGSAESSNPFGVVSSNELSFRLFNKEGMFSPTNASGPYFGKIKSGILVVPSIKPLYDDDEVDWVMLGKFYVTGWGAQITGAYADITANDRWHQIFNNKLPNYPISIGKTYSEFLTEVLGAEVNVDAALAEVLPYAFVEGTYKSFLQEVSAAALSYVTSNKQGDPVIGAFTGNAAQRAILTDADQIKTVSAKQSITRAYDGVELRYNTPQISAPEKLVEFTGLVLPVGQTSFENVTLTKGPLWNIAAIEVISPSDAVTLEDFRATQWLANMSLNASAKTTASIALYGRVLNLIDLILTDEADRLLKVTNKYVQSNAYAEFYKGVINSFIASDIPTLALSVRGNPLLNIGDRVLVQSTKYNLSFDGIIQRMSYKYAGGLSCDMLLLNNDILQGVRV